MADSVSGSRPVLVIDIGNTNTVFGLWSPEQDDFSCSRYWRTITRLDRTSDELGVYLLGFLKAARLDAVSISGCIYSSVVPSFNPIVERMTVDYFDTPARRVTWQSQLPFRIAYPRPEEIGADRLVNAAAGIKLYGPDLIIVDMGTATTFCLIEQGVYLGGSIAPGIKNSMESLIRRTAQLPPIEFLKPNRVVGQSTIEALQSGFYYGWLGLLERILAGIRQESQRPLQVLATGGLSGLIHKEKRSPFDIQDPELTLRGLACLYTLQK
ncbi:MAG: type III pantothenate kinase [Leptospiraceae bacterium]|nr:type III pantothenate kinase [Leptospiraceae bacterium]